MADQIVAVIPFRAGSKGLAGKNVRELQQKQLWWWSVEAAEASELVDGVIITTDYHQLYTENPQYLTRHRLIHRPPELATDTANLDHALIHAVNMAGLLNETLIVLLQPTVPVRRPGLIDDCIRMFLSFPAAKSLLTANRLHFVWEGDSGRLINGPRVNRQEMASSQKLYHEDGSVFIVGAGDLREHGSRVVDPVVLYETERTVDIDVERDLELAEFLMTTKKGEPG